jgi:cobalamin biosynthesis protein CobD/CbiB
VRSGADVAWGVLCLLVVVLFFFFLLLLLLLLLSVQPLACYKGAGIY